MSEHSPSTYSGEAGPCVACGRPCYPVPAGHFIHGERCGGLMPQWNEPCARRAGHGYEHRSAYAMDNASRMRSGRGLRRRVAA